MNLYFPVPDPDIRIEVMSGESHSTGNDKGLLALILVLSLVGIAAACSVVFVVLRIQKKRSQRFAQGYGHGRSGSVTLDKSHPASRIVPFGAPGGETPRFGEFPVFSICSGYSIRLLYSTYPRRRYAPRASTIRWRLGLYTNGHTTHTER